MIVSKTIMIAQCLVRPSFRSVVGFSIMGLLRRGIVGSARKVGAALLERYVGVSVFCCGFIISHGCVCAAPFSGRRAVSCMSSCLNGAGVSDVEFFPRVLLLETSVSLETISQVLVQLKLCAVPVFFY